MPNPKKIFIGSSSEALPLAHQIGNAIREAKMIPLLWDEVFPVGKILLNSIEEIAAQIDGAILLATPDVVCQRRDQHFQAPVSNVIFEYAYLAALLLRRRVAICLVEPAVIPSDLQGLTTFRMAGSSTAASSPLPEPVRIQLNRWLRQLPSLASGMHPAKQVHPYSGRWLIENSFISWRGIKLGESDKVTFTGQAFLLIEADGSAGSGMQTGRLQISARGYKAEYRIANHVLDAKVESDGTLEMRVQLMQREKIQESIGVDPDLRFSGELSGSGLFDLKLRPMAGKPKTLKGVHDYRYATEPHSHADEYYRYLGLS